MNEEKVTDTWRTPSWAFKQLDDIFKFTLDACASEHNALCERYYSRENSCLNAQWAGEMVFINPPYSHGGDFAAKCYEQRHKARGIVGVFLASVCSNWFHDFVKDHADVFYQRGRVSFDDPAGTPSGNPKHDTMVVVWPYDFTERVLGYRPDYMLVKPTKGK